MKYGPQRRKGAEQIDPNKRVGSSSFIAFNIPPHLCASAVLITSPQ